MDKKEYITKTQLKERGWTDSIIKKMDLKHDMEKDNPFYKKSAPMKLYSINKIKKIEKTKTFQELYKKVLKRKKSAQKSVKTKKEKILQFANDVDIKIDYMDDKKLTRAAIESYNSWNYNRPSVLFGNVHFEPASFDSDEDFLHRIKNNYIRHKLTNYDDILIQIKSKVGKSEAYELIKNRVEERIQEKWNTLNQTQEK